MSLTGRMMMWAGTIPLPSGPCFAMADIARIAIDDAVSNPGLLSVALNPPETCHVTETE